MKSLQIKRTLFIVAHQDDEILGCGGTLFKKSHSSMVDILFLADGSTSREEYKNLNRDDIAQKIHTSLINPGKITFLNLPDNKLDTIPLLEIIKIIEKEYNADITMLYDEVFTHSSKDLNIDHQVASKITRILFRPQPNIRTSRLLEFETPSATEWSFQSFNPNHYEDISPYWDWKLDKLKLYHEEMREFPHPRSYVAIEALSKLRGSKVGFPYAEAFEIIWQKA
jgi:N-acetylglucosamine malate deacetylase 1